MTPPSRGASIMLSRRELRVLVVTNMYPTTAEPHFGCFVRDQVEDLRRLNAEVTVLAFDGRSHKRRYVAAARRLRRAVRRGGYDVVHAHYGLSGAVAALQPQTPVVTTFHGSDAWVPWQRRVSSARCEADAADRGRPSRRRGPGGSRRAGDPVRGRSGAVCPDRPGRGAARPRLARTGPCVLFPAARNDRAKVDNKRPDVFDAMVERLRRSVPDTFAASLDGLSRAAGGPGDERRRRRRDDVDYGRARRSS